MSIIPEKYTTLSPLQEQYRKFWTLFNEISLNHGQFSSMFKIHPIPSIRCYQDYAVGKPYHLALKVNFKRNTFCVMAYFNNLSKYIEYYEQHRHRIECELGCELEWKQQTTAGSAELNYVADLFDEKQHNKIGNQMMNKAIKLIEIFNEYSEQ